MAHGTPTASGHGQAKPGEIAIGVIIGRTSEFFDFFVYAIASVIVFPKLVFPFVNELTGTLYSFGIFALAFAARPLGTVIFMAVDRRHGKGAKLVIALFLLGTATVALAFLPGYDTIGVAAIWLLAAARVLQGIAWGGAWDGLASLLAMNSPANRRGWYAMVPQLGAPLGLIVASALFAFFAGNLSADDFFDWGWRYPFFVAFAINVVALFARLRMVATDEYSELFESRDLEPARVGETVAQEGRNILLGAFAPLASFALFHMVTVFPLSWVFLFTRESPVRFLIIEMIGAMVGVVAIIASGMIADRVGRKPLLLGSAVAIAVYSGFCPAAARCRCVRRDDLHGARLRAARAVVRPVVRRDRLELRADLSLHRLGADLGFRLAVRRRLCAARRAVAGDAFRPDLGRRVSVVGRRVDAARAVAQRPARSGSQLVP
ncbi:MFS family permease [Bradyrhizobium sp. USDA 4341]